MMLIVCEKHVTNGVKEIDAPHVQRIINLKDKGCLFCNQKASYKIFEILDINPTLRNRLKVQKMLQFANET
ncbi:hypothetical protein QFZ28_002630 [Neobacillus niacini]|uniref:hypothetical protein n=1 Tax=Neobacillus niacini TaxID=86668 RepID=UPI00278095B4|nr:hypothetical protein [Neobacillus niacini]MDQ1002230.1 hypothetical protein [Neobacillus niacini]